MPRARDGFTLLEVLAAVAVLGFLFTILVGSGIQGLRAEGAAERRLRASLLADSLLAELEAGLAGGAVPAVGLEESERDGFDLAIEVAPLELDLLQAQTAGAPPAPRDAAGGPTLLAAPGSGGAAALRSVEIRVAWDAGGAPQQVVRRNFVFDRASVESTLAALTAPGEEEQ